MKHYHIYIAKDGNRFIQTSNKYLAHALVFCGYEFKALKIKDITSYSFVYSDELLDTVERIISTRKEYLAETAKK